MNNEPRDTPGKNQPQVWPPPLRRAPRVQTVWPPKDRSWSGWQFFLCFLGMVCGCVCCLLLTVLMECGILFLGIGIALMLIVVAIIWRTSSETGVGVMIGCMAMAVFFFVVRFMMEHTVK